MREINHNVEITVVDEANEVCGAMPRQQALQEGYNYRTIHVIGGDNRHVYLQRLSDGHLKSPGLLGSTAAGYLQRDESSKQAAKRLLLKELNCIAETLTKVVSTQMIEGDSTKFIDIFTAEIQSVTTPNPTEFKEIEELEFAQVDQLVEHEPSRFTTTFIVAYAALKECCHWKTR